MRPRRRLHVLAGMRLPLTAFIRILRDPDARGSALLVVSLFLLGTAFYASVEGWSLVGARSPKPTVASVMVEK